MRQSTFLFECATEKDNTWRKSYVEMYWLLSDDVFAIHRL